MLADTANPVFTLRSRGCLRGTDRLQIGGQHHAHHRDRLLASLASTRARGLMTAAVQKRSAGMAFGEMGMERVEIRCARGQPAGATAFRSASASGSTACEVRGEQLADGEFIDLQRLPCCARPETRKNREGGILSGSTLPTTPPRCRHSSPSAVQATGRHPGTTLP